MTRSGAQDGKQQYISMTFGSQGSEAMGFPSHKCMSPNTQPRHSRYTSPSSINEYLLYTYLELGPVLSVEDTMVNNTDMITALIAEEAERKQGPSQTNENSSQL